MTLDVVSLFAGIGAIDLAAERAGMRTALVVTVAAREQGTVRVGSTR